MLLRLKRQGRFLCGLAACLLFTGFAFAGDLRLTVKDLTAGAKLFSVDVKAYGIFELATIHSVTRTPYSHFFKVDEKGEIILDRTVYESFGGGYPLSGDGEFHARDGKFYMNNMNRHIGVLRLRVSPVSRETLRVSGQEYALYEMVPEGTRLQIKAVPADE